MLALMRTTAPRNDGTDRSRLGLAAELRAGRFLERRGLKVLARNFSCRAGELDLVCIEGPILVIVEVRRRSSRAFGGALASVTAAKRRRIRIAAAVYLGARPGLGRMPVRFDVIGIDAPRGAPGELVWIRDAF